LAAKPAKKSSFHFEKSLAELEKLVQQMEQGELSLEDSLKHFEKGVQLTRSCQQALQEAEQKVAILLEKNDQTSLEKFDAND